MPRMKYKGDIDITNNGIIIYPYKKGQCKQLERMTSVYDKVYHRRDEVTGFVIPYIDMDAFVTYGMNPNFIQGLFPDYQIHSTSEITPRYTLDFALNDDIQLKDIQSNIITKVIQTKNRNDWFINLPTAQGKTLISTYLSSIFSYKTLILTFSTGILRQWIETFTTKTTIDPSRILLIQSMHLLDEIYNNEFDYTQYDIFLCTTNLITQYINRNMGAKLDPIARKIGIGFRIYDEAHLHKGAMIRINALMNVRHTLYLSADYAQANRDLENMYYDIFSKTMIIKPTDEEIASMKYTKAIVMEFDSNPDEIEKESIYNRYGFSSQKYMDYELSKESFYLVLDDIMSNIINVLTQRDEMGETLKYRTLILASNVSHVDKIYDYLYSKYKDKVTVGKMYANSGTPEEKKWVKHQADVVVATYKSFGTGIDTTNIKYIIGTNQSNKIEDNQAAGRGRPLPDGTDIFYFMIIDRGFSYCKKKLRTRLNYINEQKVKAVNRLKVYL